MLTKSWASNYGPRSTSALLTLYFVALVAALSISGSRKEVVSSFEWVT